jgi:hypothetical protein
MLNATFSRCFENWAENAAENKEIRARTQVCCKKKREKKNRKRKEKEICAENAAENKEARSRTQVCCVRKKEEKGQRKKGKRDICRRHGLGRRCVLRQKRTQYRKRDIFSEKCVS